MDANFQAKPMLPFLEGRDPAMRMRDAASLVEKHIRREVGPGDDSRLTIRAAFGYLAGVAGLDTRNVELATEVMFSKERDDGRAAVLLGQIIGHAEQNIPAAPVREGK